VSAKKVRFIQEMEIRLVTKKAAILHGTDSTPSDNWFPWLKQELEDDRYEVWVPELPGNHIPDKKVYGDFLFGSDWDFANSIVIGHSSGAVEVLNMLMDDRCPNIDTAVIVSGWEHGTPTGMDAYQFENLFPENGFDFEKIKQKVKRIEFIHADDDPYCTMEQAKHMASELDARLTVIEGGGHLGENYIEFPQLLRLTTEGER